MAYFDKNETIARAILDGVVAAFDATDFDLPARQVIGYAGMPIDCEMLAVLVNRMYSVNKPTGPDSEAVAAHRCFYWAGSDIDILLVRCTPQPTAVRDQLRAVTPTVLEAFAKVAMADPHIIARGVVNTFTDGFLGDGANIAFGDTAVVGDESGMLIGIRARVRVGNAL